MSEQFKAGDIIRFKYEWDLSLNGPNLHEIIGRSNRHYRTVQIGRKSDGQPYRRVYATAEQMEKL